MKFQIKIAKAKTNLEVDFDAFPPEVKAYIVEQGLSKLLNAATAKETVATTPDDATREANSLAHAQKKLENLQAGQMTARRASKSDGKTPAAVMTEARRQAKIIVKAQAKAKGKRLTDYTPKAWTEAANIYLNDNPALIEAAQAAINAAAALAAQAEMDVSTLVADPKLVAANEAKKEAARKATAAKNAGKPGPQKSAIKKQAKPQGTLPVSPKRAPAEVHAQH